MLRPHSATGRRACAALLAATAIAVAAAAPRPATADTESELRDAMAEVETLQQAAAQAHERYEAAQGQLAAVTARLADLDISLEEAQSQLAQSQRSLGRVARASYMAGGLEGSWFLLLSPDADTFGRSLNDLRRVGDGAAQQLEAAQRTADTVSRLRSSIAAEQELAAGLQQESAQAAQQAAAALQEAVQREADLQRRHAAEVAAVRAAQQAQAQQDAAAARGQLTAPAAASGPQPAGPAPVVAGGARERLVAWALDQVGARYVLNAEGPDAFDCSGFVTAAYATIGVAVPSYTGAQADRVTPVPLAQAQPGDLLFYFGRGAQHVALYIGDGRMVHAVNPARGVTVNRLSDSWYRERFTMAGRLID